MREIQRASGPYSVDWGAVTLPNDKHALLPNPFEA
jgi:hypothetical protein